MKNKILKYFIYTFAAIILFACTPKQSKYEGYSCNKTGIYYKLIALGEDTSRAQINDYITINIAYSTLNDSIFFKNKRKIQITKPNFNQSIDNCFLFMNLGDSTSFILDANLFFSQTLGVPIPSFIDTTNLFKVNIRLLEIQTYKEYQKQKQEFLTWIKDFGAYEQLFLKNYLQEKNLDTISTVNGIYQIILKKGISKKPSKGDTLTINYEGKFLNGVFFDSTIKRNKTFELIFGTQWQVIDGLEKAIAMMNEGEKSLFILPSNVAFGAKGSSSGIVPPYTSVIFEVELIKIAKGISPNQEKSIIIDSLPTI
jgi:FKBP-type peptidyl-prolyl cis-trans isomerase FkpA